jgi:hypothetical protein
VDGFIRDLPSLNIEGQRTLNESHAIERRPSAETLSVKSDLVIAFEWVANSAWELLMLR